MWIETSQEGRDHNFKFYQSNHEGDLIDTLHDEREWAGGIILNAGALSHYSYALRDAVESINIDTIEVHISDINSREDFRKISIIKDVCLEQISGLGKVGYIKAIKVLMNA